MERKDVSNLYKKSEEPRGYSAKYWINDGTDKLVKYNNPACPDSDVMESLSSNILKLLNIPVVNVWLGYNRSEEEIKELDLTDNRCAIIESFLTQKGDIVYSLPQTWSKIESNNIEKQIRTCFFKVTSMFDRFFGNDEVNKAKMKTDYIRQIFGDCIIGNEDRRINNIGVIYNEKSHDYRLAPSFDNALAFSAYNIGSDEEYCYIGNQEFEIKDVLDYLTTHYYEHIEDLIMNFIEIVDSGSIDILLNNYKDEIESKKLEYISTSLKNKKEFIQNRITKNKSKIK
ncbi:MAG: hypothetical protein IJ093_00345 [Bacilli bacterium]|nr:hypothetical protein [Bacilli bacterium]